MTDPNDEYRTAEAVLREPLGLGQGETPFPWQARLFARLMQMDVPSAVDIPTGLGKTAVMALWLAARSQGAKLPRRLVYIVDRRAVVDQATTEAERLRAWVDKSPHIRRALGLSGSLPISTLRGQHVDNRQWLEDPASPAIIVGTVDMVGSRLLFEGYGVSRKMRPYHAGLLGSDTLVVLDEAHLVPPFEKLLESIASGADEFGPAGIEGSNPVPRFHLMSLSATGRGSQDSTHGLTDQDLLHPDVQKRLGATKRLVLKALEDTRHIEGQRNQKTDLADALAHEAWNLAGNGRASRVIVFCHSRDVAGKVKNTVEKFAAGNSKSDQPQVEIETALFVGGRRVFEREQARQRLEALGFLAGSVLPRLKPAFLFATSAAEVGVDLNADHMVCDLVAWERMVQRLGRVNRRGNGAATVMVVVEAPNIKEQEAMDKQSRGETLDAKARKVIEGVEARSRQIQARLEPLKRLPLDDHGFDASPDALRKLKQVAESDPAVRKLLEDATTPAPLRPALTRALVDAWSLTSLQNHPGRPAIDPWLRGWLEKDPPQTAVVWRAHLPVRSGGPPPYNKEVESFFEAAPPHASEILETEAYRALGWLYTRSESLLTRSRKGEEDLPARDQIVAFVLARDGSLLQALRLDELDAKDQKGAAKKPKEMLVSELAGATLVVDKRVAGLKDGLLEPSANAPPQTADDGQGWLGDGVVRFRVRSVAVDDPLVSEPVWRERLRFAAEVSSEDEVHRWLIVEKWRHDAATEEDRSAAPHPQLLDEHQSWVERRARALAKRLDVGPLYEETLATAAALHDEGKRAKQWQRAFNAPEGGPFAKTKGPINYALLDGYRHELGSLLRAQGDRRIRRLPEEIQDLVLHLIAAHHGFARPLIGMKGCEDLPPSVIEEHAEEVALRFARLQRRWGPWGLAWWESLLRAADQQASRDNDTVECAKCSREA